jgi:hypothetical protein
MSKENKSGGIGCLTVIGIVFVILKILAVEPVVNWSWLWVLCPFWIPLAIGLVFIFGFFIFGFIIGLFKK